VVKNVIGIEIGDIENGRQVDCVYTKSSKAVDQVIHKVQFVKRSAGVNT
jgi:hypothetical protein